jgi:hypothetical protein
VPTLLRSSNNPHTTLLRNHESGEGVYQDLAVQCVISAGCLSWPREGQTQQL